LLGYSDQSVRIIARSLLQTAAEHGRKVTFPSPAYYDACQTVGDLVNLRYGRIR
jgi:3-polyprenyl-4-hydroxybenzoate decarboxylase